MYQSKTQGRNQYTFFTDELENSEQSMINFENELREAIESNQLKLHYQPLIDIKNTDYIACEALLRWQHPEKGLMFPDKFISILENSDLMVDMTCWVIREVQDFQSKVYRNYNFIPYISINLPPTVFQQKHYIDKIQFLLLEQIAYPEKIVLEITEDTLITDMTATSLSLKLLHDKGYRVALDDFGTGQSSLSHLRAFPIDIIKIDKEFIRDVHNDQNDANLVTAIISLGHDLGMKIIAEGVEYQTQLDFLSERGCHNIQGYLFNKPMPESDYMAYLNKNAPAIKA